MPDRPTTSTRSEVFVQQMTDRLTALARTLSAWVQADAYPLQAIEAQAVRVLRDLGTSLLAALPPRAAPVRPEPDVPCDCGQQARSVRVRPATVTTVPGRITIERAIDQRQRCGTSHAPLDRQMQIAAGGHRLGLRERLALPGATQDSCAQAASVPERLCLVQGCPNRVRAATEDPGAARTARAQEVVTAAQTTHTTPPAAQDAPSRVSLGMDGVVAHVHAAGWPEITVGCASTTRTRIPHQRPETLVIQAEQQRDLAALTDAGTFGRRRWAAARRRGVTDQTDLVVIGGGARWIGNLADEHVPQATRIVDWYRAGQYARRAAATIDGATGTLRIPWARQHLDALWGGHVADVLAALEPYRANGEGVADARSAVTTQQRRMDAAADRARGLPVGTAARWSAPGSTW